MRLARLSLFAALALLAALPPALAGRGGKRQIIVFKDGFIVRGRVSQPTTLHFDSASGASIRMAVPGGFMHIDDGVRTIIFPPTFVQDSIDDESAKKLVPIDLVYTPYSSQPLDLPPSWSIEEITPFNEKWQRKVKLDTPKGFKTEDQRLVKLTPQFAFVQARHYKWNCFYFTRELGPEVARGLVYKHMKLTKRPVSKFDQRMLIYRFMLQAGWTEHAVKELDYMLVEFKSPGERKRLEPLRENLEKLRNTQFVQEIEQCHKAGQYQEAQNRIARFYDLKMDEQIPPEFALKVQELKSKYAATDEKLKELRRLLKALPREVPKQEADFCKEAVKALLAELNYDTHGRLDTFLSQAQDRERARKQGRPPNSTPQDLLAFAVSGWLLGDQAAERSPKLARKLWAAREAVLRSEADGDPAAIKQRAASFANDKEVTVDVVARMIPQLPPADPYEKLGVKPIPLTPPGGGAAYHVQLPPEYHHGRPFPVLIALHHSAGGAGGELQLWGELAAKHGFIVMAPAWGKKGGKYQYSPREHAAVLDSLRDLRRRFQVDSDRVFLCGCEEGGKMAYDVGLSHPDLFAGVLPVSGSPLYFPFRYWSNARFLPFYAVTGQLGGKIRADNRSMFKEWIPKRYPSLLVEYKGRGAGFFACEQETMFDWMSRKKRYTPVKDAGVTGEEFKTMRETDNRFYWLSTTAINLNRLNWKQRWNPNTVPATMHAHIFQQNQINVHTSGLSQLTLWLGPGMVNYGQKVLVRVNGAGAQPYQITPSLEVLLGELAHVGDRQRLFWARLDLRV
jgi:pimeloyl-ACP methyl ester carboxylesterase